MPVKMGVPRHDELAIKEEARQLCVNDLHYLAKTVLGYDRLTDHYHKQMAHDIDTPNYKFKLLLHPRGHFKSTIGTEARSVQKLCKNPDERILLTNAKLDNSRKFLRAISNHFSSGPTFRWLWRDWWLEQYTTQYHKDIHKEKLDWVLRDTQDEFIVLRPGNMREASITTGAVDASLVSQHYSSIIADDLINREFVRTVDMVEKSILYFKDLLDLLDPGGSLEIIGTRWSHVDLYGWIIDEFGGVASLHVPDNYVSESVMKESLDTEEENKDWLISIQPCKRDDGTPVFPEEFNSKVLDNLLKAKGPYEFGAQYLLNPTPDEHQKFKSEWFQTIDVLPDLSKLDICITVDPAKSIADNADNTAMVVCGYDKSNNMFFLDGRDEKLTIDELPEVLFELVVKWNQLGRYVYPVGIESISFQETYVYTLERMMRERRYFFPIHPIPGRSQSKNERILGLVPRIKNGFYCPKRIPITPHAGGDEYDLVQRIKWQLLKFPFTGDRDDLADAMSDQMMIVHSTSLPTAKPESPKAKAREFVHSSIKQDERSDRRSNNIIPIKSFGAVK